MVKHIDRLSALVEAKLKESGIFEVLKRKKAGFVKNVLLSTFAT